MTTQNYMIGNDESVFQQWQEPAKRPACSRCRQQKLRCLRTGPSSDPCLRCQRANVPCVIGPMGRVGRPPRDSGRLEQHRHENMQSVVPMNLANLVGIAEQQQDQTGVWKRILGGHETGPLPPEWAGTSSCQSDVPSSVVRRPGGDVSYDTSAVPQTNGGIASEDSRGNKDITSHHYSISSIGNSACHQTSFMLGDAPNGRIAPSATGTNDDPVQASLRSSGEGLPATRMHRLLVLQSRILLQGENLELPSFSQPDLGYSTKGKLNHLLQDCSDLTAILTEVDNPKETRTTPPSDSALSTWLGLTPTDSDGVWSDSHLSDSFFCSGSNHRNISAAVDAEDACRISHRSTAEMTTQDIEPFKGGSRRAAQSVVRARIQKISDYISRKPLF
ncbi:hypothetical protein BDP67DRAFT_490565 [Colletotrichum lupini]|nr:hypothetical protein BDP67DRAFT_490565 [Colletotrichum lupini]